MLNSKFKRCQFIAGAKTSGQIPQNLYLKEVALAGRSNVGKSSLLNALTLQKDLARTSKTPGRTQQINFFSIEKFITLVDLPGYGYSKVSKSTVKEWADLIAFYISSREQLQQVLLLIDSRRGIKSNDLEVIDWLEFHSIKYTIVLTKVDKLNNDELVQVQNEVTNIINAKRCGSNEIITTSTAKTIGLEKLRNYISGYANSKS